MLGRPRVRNSLRTGTGYGTWGPGSSSRPQSGRPRLSTWRLQPIRPANGWRRRPSEGRCGGRTDRASLRQACRRQLVEAKQLSDPRKPRPASACTHRCPVRPRSITVDAATGVCLGPQHDIECRGVGRPNRRTAEPRSLRHEAPLRPALSRVTIGPIWGASLGAVTGILGVSYRARLGAEPSILWSGCY